MRPPGFWFAPAKRPGLASSLLLPLGALWTQSTRRRLAQPGARVDAPVVVVGNLTAGGTGKTPTVAWLVAHLAGLGRAPHVVTRGHGGREKGPLRVDPARHGAGDVGDEALLHAALAPTWVARDRAAGARAAVADGAEVILLDDGFQNPSLEKDLSILVIDAETGFGNGRVIPAGPLREPVADGLARADLAVLIGPDAARARFLGSWTGGLPLVEARLAPLRTGMDWSGLRVFAFAGIGRPEKFFATLESLGATVAGRAALDDHQPITPALFARIEADARAAGAQLVTTEKDAARMPSHLRRGLLVLPVRLEIDDPAPLTDALAELHFPSAASIRSDISE